MPPPTEAVEIVVIGSGPAGCAAARGLATLGHSVALLPGHPTGRPRHAESLAPSVRKPLGALGMLERIERADFVPTRGNAIAWEEPTLRRVEFPGACGFQVERGAFDGLLLSAAAEAGARILPGAYAAALLPTAGAEATVAWRSRSGGGELRAAYVLDCTGRSGIAARRGLRRAVDGPRTTALIGSWTLEGPGPLPDPGDTLVEAWSGGWVWSVPASRTRRDVAVMLDPALTPLHAASMGRVYLDAIAATRHARELVRGGSLGAGPWATAASPFAATTYADGPMLLVGDAGSFIDPLSSFGVKKALVSGTTAAVVVHTALIDAARAAPAMELFEYRERLAAAEYGRQAADLYRQGADRFGTEFWRCRSRTPDGEDERPGPNSQIAGAHADEAAYSHAVGGAADRLKQAVESIRAPARLQLRPAADLAVVPRPTIRGSEVVLEDHLVSPALPGGVRYFGGVELPRLVDVLRTVTGVPELYEAYLGEAPPVPIGEFVGALATLLAHRLVEPTFPTAHP